MAFISKQVKAVAAGSVVAPALFSYNTTDTLAAVTTAGYLSDAALFLQVNDIILAMTGAEGAKVLTKLIVTARVIKDDGTAHTLTVITHTSFVGDTRATDTAGFLKGNLSRGIDGANGLYSYYTYRNNTDVKAVIAAADYFIEAGTYLEVGDIIEAVGNDGTLYLRVLTAGPAGVTTGSILLTIPI